MIYYAAFRLGGVKCRSLALIWTTISDQIGCTSSSHVSRTLDMLKHVQTLYNYLLVVIFYSPAQEQLCINVTSSLIHILKATQASWRQDFQQGSSSSTSQSEDSTFKFPTHRRTASGRLLASEGTASEPSAAITRVERTLALLHSVRFVSQTRQRTRFVPFLLRNSTGLPLQFTTLTSAPSQVYTHTYMLL